MATRVCEEHRLRGYGLAEDACVGCALDAARARIAVLETEVGAPDTRCITTPDGGCVGDGCMHDAAPPDAKAEAPNCSRCGCPKEAHRFLEIERGCEIAEARARAEAAEKVLRELAPKQGDIP